MLPSIEIFGITISEPMTTVTDYLVTGFGFSFGLRLMVSGPGRIQAAQKLWALAFLFIGIGALLGGTSHGFVTYLGDDANHYIWKGTVYAIGLSMLFAVSGTITAASPGPTARFLLHVVNVLGFAIYAVWMIGHDGFVYVIYHYVPAMLAIAIIHGWMFAGNRAPGAPWVIAGVTVSLAGAVIQQSGFTLDRHFNNNDLYHVIQIIGLYLLFRGTSLYDR